MNDILTMRTELANDFAVAGAKLLSFTATAGVVAAIPNTEPQQYAVAGTLESIRAVLPVETTPGRRKDDRHPTEPLVFEDEAEQGAESAAAPAVMFDRQHISRMYNITRMCNHDIPDEALDSMKEMLIAALLASQQPATQGEGK